ncbi:DHH phosphoesterase, partial [Ascodesmis nigricans]
LSLRPEFLHLLHHPRLQIPPSSLLFAPDHNLTNRPVHLVDHNTPALAAIRDNDVIGIIDHHDDEGHYPNATPRLVQKAGSCTSLILHHFHTNGTATAALGVSEKRELAVLAMAAVLIDTANMTMRVTPYDSAAVALLESWLSEEDEEEGMGKWDREEFYQALAAAKKSVDSLSLRDLLRKDYKQWADGAVTLGIASVVKPLRYLLEEKAENCIPDFLETLEKYAREEGLDVLAVMTTDGDGEEFKRELLVWGVTDVGKEVVAEVEKGWDKVGLGLEVWGDGKLDANGRWAWRQGRVEWSRKQVAPWMRECAREVV